MGYLAELCRNAYVLEMLATPAKYQQANQRRKELEETLKAVQDQAKAEIASKKNGEKQKDNTFWS
jgi:hypothetical protein